MRASTPGAVEIAPISAPPAAAPTATAPRRRGIIAKKKSAKKKSAKKNRIRRVALARQRIKIIFEIGERESQRIAYLMSGIWSFTGRKADLTQTSSFARF
jgi:hypothetical protein